MNFCIEKWTDTIEIEADSLEEAEEKAEAYLEDRDMGRAVIDCTLNLMGRLRMSKYYEVEDDIENICLDCHHVGFTHAEHEIEGQDEAEVVCPKCYSTYYFVIAKEEKENA